MSVENFIRFASLLSEFEDDLNNNVIPVDSIHIVGVHQEELKSTWEKVKEAYDKLLIEIASDNIPGDHKIGLEKAAQLKESARLKYKSSYLTYCKCQTVLGDILMKLKGPTESSPLSDGYNSKNCFSLPACDTPTFHGDYLSWPTFRDSFTATFIRSNLSPIQKLLHLRQKTKGEAFDIVSQAPLEDSGFELAWSNLSSRFENKRILVNGQLKKLFDLPTISMETGPALESFQRDINSCLSNLKLYGIDISTWDPILVFFCSSKIPTSTLTLWEHTLLDKTSIPKWSDLDTFLSNRYRTLESVAETRSAQKSFPKHLKTFQTNVNVPNCPLCMNKTHIIRQCPNFNSMLPKDRWAEIKKLKLCINCFSKTHGVAQCTSRFSCSKCSKKHHSLLHWGQSNSNPLNPQSVPFTPDSSIQSTNIQTCYSSNSQGVLLGTAMIEICFLDSRYKVRALLDSGSEGSFISERLFHRLKLPFTRSNATISGLNNSISATATKRCSFIVSSSNDPNVQISVAALVVPHLSGNLPSNSIPQSMFSSLPQIPFADPQFYNSSKIDVLLGGNIFPNIMLSGHINGICGSLLAQETIFGWILTGPISESNIIPRTTTVSYHCGLSLKEEISRFWVVENLPRKNFLTDSEKYCEKLYTESTTRNKDGRYVVALPFKDRFPDTLQLGQSRSSALAQFYRNENRLIRNPELKADYDKALLEYIELGHMKEIKTEQLAFPKAQHFYLPHHAVIKSESTTTKVRVVFNASSPSSNGLSLNDVLHIGPSLQTDLILLLHRWRLYKYVFNADIQQMYRQVLVRAEDRPFQRIIFRSDPSTMIKEYQLNTVTFGVNCAPYLAIRTLLQLAEDSISNFPLASKILQSSMYVDDVLAGFHSIQEANEAKFELISVLESAGFILRKWTSNNKDIIKSLPIEHRLHKNFLEFDSSSIAKTLGIRWNAMDDSFYFLMKSFSENIHYTKRKVLSDIAKLFDPAGWLAPCIIIAKIIMQRIWRENIDWDDEISSDIKTDWVAFLSNLSFINSISIPRWFGVSPEAKIQFHGFCDASEKAYAAALYIRIEINNNIKVELVCSKTKVAPIKTLSIPRLELCGAVLLAELVDSVVPRLEIPQYSIYCWTDSTIVRSWLAKHPSTWKTFVAHRISTIIEIVDPKYWFHVLSEENPADLASRGIYPNILAESELWWHGPNWLKGPCDNWNSSAPSETEIEMKPIKCHTLQVSDHDDPLTRFSSFSKALRCISYVYRFYYRTHPKHKSDFVQNSKEITNLEIIDTRKRLIIMYQKLHYSKEYSSFKLNKSIPSSSSILSLNPFMSDKIIRCCGRLEYAPGLSYDEKHPIILPYNSHFVRLLIRFVHDISLHGGNQLVLRLIRSQFWIPKVKNLIKFTINHCKSCILYKQRCKKQLMAALPVERTQISRPFAHTGIDFAGPFNIKGLTGRYFRITKGYVCVFVCFSTKSIHLEATSDLSTTTFLSAFQRFISRRGCPLHIHSDNGTNFVGASKILAKEFLTNSKRVVENKFAHQNIQWHFIPPGAPHMGGLWEAAVKSFKTHIRKIPETNFTFEEFSTLLSKIEACLNSRPLSPQSSNPTDLSALTPGHFLTGGPILAPIETVSNDMSLINRWQRIKIIYQEFCLRWKNEYLRELQKRTKWKTPYPNFQVNDLVIVIEENLPPNKWRLGRVTQLHTGKDSRVRVVDLRTERGTISRPITKLIGLPLTN